MVTKWRGDNVTHTPVATSTLRKRVYSEIVSTYVTMENWLAQLGAGTKHLTERIAEYPSAVHDHHYYGYESPSQVHGASSKHHYGGGNKGNAAMSALTLLAFLFFLHILQQCLKEHMTAMTPQVMVVSAGRQEPMFKTNKVDKAGLVDEETSTSSTRSDGENPKVTGEFLRDLPSSTTDSEVILTRIATAVHTPKTHKYKNVDHSSASSIFDGFVSAMDKR